MKMKFQRITIGAIVPFGGMYVVCDANRRAGMLLPKEMADTCRIGQTVNILPGFRCLDDILWSIRE